MNHYYFKKLIKPRRIILVFTLKGTNLTFIRDNKYTILQNFSTFSTFHFHTLKKKFFFINFKSIQNPKSEIAAPNIAQPNSEYNVQQFQKIIFVFS